MPITSYSNPTQNGLNLGSILIDVHGGVGGGGGGTGGYLSPNPPKSNGYRTEFEQRQVIYLIVCGIVRYR